MSLNDPIANMLTSIRNAIQAHKLTVDIPASKLKGTILEIFKTQGYIEDCRLMKNDVQGTFKVYLKYEGKKSAIIGIKRISKSGLRVYAPRNKVPRVLNGLGTAIISTSKGVLDDHEARRQGVGGEVLCYIW
ncbi:MAG TPA: 30S ribosomal protein S8 [Candidatus Omnitrophota bacterium]|nr:30S ribosomal protein S8 [Candidatus Omnitrophota bacterium]HPB67472.1 30S ribosomal protein S8 [Candidatus Omnitrophota bacterium]HQO57481.1 30S ribosomal protein S8 [Candidatus Omnitrophota bacterium]HQP11490.1 30S ribosomal protein S8 [Candidatus Omnitrophota bacterium]